MSWPKLDTKQWYKLIIASALTLAIVLILILLPLRATALDITISGAATSDKPNTMCLTASLTFQTSESIPITSIEAIISGATDVTIQFDVNGNVVSVTGDLTESYIGASISKMESYNYGYGYRIGYENGYQYDFGYGYGYGYSAGATVVRYVICFDAEYLNTGDHNFQVKVNTGEVVKPSFSSDLHAFHITGTSLTLTVGWNE